MTHTAESLRAFEADVAAAFNAGRIRAPVHLDGGNEAPLLEYFAARWHPGDWTCGSWRMHYKCLLAGVPPEILMTDILAGRSITLTYPEHRIVSSAIVGGILPIALGLALGIKRAGGAERVHCFLGDMTAMTGAFAECRRYALGHDLPVNWIVEDNGKSVLTDTQEVWGSTTFSTGEDGRGVCVKEETVFRYGYELSWPHSGTGVRVIFF
jgi:TPP-dependent pyruvate/acetoin dehydrogenase alpha subunit